MAAAQALGAAIGNVVVPHNIIAGCATVGLAGGEGSMMQRTAPACLVYLLATGCLVLMLVGR
jgi:lactate permease